MRKYVSLFKRSNVTVAVAMMALIGINWAVAPRALAQETAPQEEAAMGQPTGVTHETKLAEYKHGSMNFAFLAAALATGLGSIAAGIAVGSVGSSAMGAVAERPELMGKSLIYVALAEGIAIYGLLISIIILAKV